MTRSMAGKSAEPSVADSAGGARNSDDNLSLFVPPALLVSLIFFFSFPEGGLVISTQREISPPLSSTCLQAGVS